MKQALALSQMELNMVSARNRAELHGSPVPRIGKCKPRYLTSRKFTFLLHFVLTASSLVGACLKGASEKETAGHRVVTRFYLVSLSLAGLGRDEGPVAVAGAPRDRAKLHDPEKALRAGTHDGSLISVPL